MVSTRVAEGIDQAKNLLGRWSEQECSASVDHLIKDRDVNACLLSLGVIREFGTPAQVAEIDRLVGATEMLINSPNRRQEKFDSSLFG